MCNMQVLCSTNSASFHNMCYLCWIAYLVLAISFQSSGAEIQRGLKLAEKIIRKMKNFHTQTEDVRTVMVWKEWYMYLTLSARGKSVQQNSKFHVKNNRKKHSFILQTWTKVHSTFYSVHFKNGCKYSTASYLVTPNLD